MRGFRREHRLGELARAKLLGGRGIGLVGLRVLDQVAVEALAVAHGRLEADRILDQVEQLADPLDGEAALLGDLLDRWVAIQLLVRTRRARSTFRACSATWTGRRIVRPWSASARGDGLANPPGRIGRELEAELPVELLDRADQSEISLLDQVEERNAGFRVVARDRHHEAQVALDQLAFRRLVAGVLAAGELALFLRL